MQDTGATHVRTRLEMGKRWLESHPGKTQFLGKAEQQHYSGGMNCPGGFRLLFQLQNVNSLQHLSPHSALELLTFRDPESIVITSPIPPDQVNCITSPRSQLSKLYGSFSRFVRNPNAGAAVAESADTLPIGAICAFRVKKRRCWLHDNDQNIAKIGG